MRALPLLLTVAACNYKPGVGVESDGPDPDGDPPADTTDAPPDSFIGPPPTACVQKWLDGTMTFTAPAFLPDSTLNPITTSSNERDPWLSPDELVVYFVATGNTGVDDDLFFASRTNLGGDFSAPVTSSLSDSNQDDLKVSMTQDTLTAFVSSSRASGKGGTDIWQGTRTTDTGMFPALAQTALDNVNTSADQLDPHLSTDGLRLYFANGNPQQILVAGRTSVEDVFGVPTAIPVAPDASGDADPTLSGDERVLIFVSNRAGGEGGTDLWYATRVERDQPFNTPQPLAEINTVDFDSDPYLTADGCHLYFASTQATVGSDFDVFFTQQQ